MDDYIVESRSDHFLRAEAESYLKSVGADFSRPIDIFGLVQRSEVKTLYGLKRLRFEALPDGEMAPDDGRTSYAKQTVSIQVRESVENGAKVGALKPRMTLAHELAHAILHQGPRLARRTVEPTRPSYIEPSRSAEHQAKVFGAALLMPMMMISTCSSVLEISERCLVSVQAARIQFELLTFSERRSKNAAKMRALADEIKQTSGSQSRIFHYLADPCPGCGGQTLSPVGSKAFCAYCMVMFDNYQDGDSQS